MIIISVIRKDASKRLTLSTTRDYYLAVLQIFESTNDVVDYHVWELDDRTFTARDMYLPDSKGFSKWKPVSK